MNDMSAEQNAGRTVTIVLDPAYGSELVRLARHGPLWVIRSADNERAWRESGPFAENSALFSAPDRASRLESLTLALPDIMDHFGNESFPDDPYTRCNVVGLGASSDVVDALKQAGITTVAETEEGLMFRLPF